MKTTLRGEDLRVPQAYAQQPPDLGLAGQAPKRPVGFWGTLPTDTENPVRFEMKEKIQSLCIFNQKTSPSQICLELGSGRLVAL